MQLRNLRQKNGERSNDFFEERSPSPLSTLCYVAFVVKTLLQLWSRGEVFPSAGTRRFRRFNSQVWVRPRPRKKAAVLVELASGAPTSLTFSYVANALAAHLDGEISAFVASKSKFYHLSPTLYWLLYRLFWGFVSEQGRIYRSFGATRLVVPVKSLGRLVEARKLTRLFFDSFPSKNDLERLEVRGVRVGDLFYDTYLRTSGEPTINFSDRRFRWFLTGWVEEALYWADRIQEGRVAAVIVSHSVYNLAVPLRMALSCGVPGFQVGGGGLKRLTQDRPRPEAFFQDFPIQFAQLSREDQEAGLAEAQSRIDRRFDGNLGVDMTYQKISAFGQPRGKRLLRESSRPKILVATHCFSDAPHFYGINLFPDFWEWLNFLGRLTEEADFDWYLKSHPDCHGTNSMALNQIVDKFPQFSILPLEASHHQLIEEGITAALTVYGTIGFEYAALGVPVVNASTKNPHVGYDFNFHPQTVQEYKNLVLRAASLRKPGEKEFRAVREYYFMTHLHSAKSNPFGLDFREHRRQVTENSGYRDHHLFGGFLSSWSLEKHDAAYEFFRLLLAQEMA